jgi:hypothetical protein
LLIQISRIDLVAAFTPQVRVRRGDTIDGESMLGKESARSRFIGKRIKGWHEPALLGKTTRVRRSGPS